MRQEIIITDHAQPEHESQAGALQAALEERLARMETQLESLASQAKGREQKVLELETSELIANRLMGWAKLFAFWVALPFVLFLLVLALLLGKSWKDLNDLVVVTRNSLQPILNEAHTRADDAKKVASGAQEEANKVRDSVEPIRQGISDLQNQVNLGLQSLQALTKEMGEASDGVQQLRARVTESSQQVRQLSHQVEAVSNEKNLATLRQSYPVFGERVVLARTGQRLDVQEKKPEDVYISLVVSMSTDVRPSERKVNDMAIAAAVTSLQSTGYTVFTGGIQLTAMTADTSMGVAYTSPLACGDKDMAGLPGGPPCILYFRHDLDLLYLRLQIL